MLLNKEENDMFNLRIIGERQKFSSKKLLSLSVLFSFILTFTNISVKAQSSRKDIAKKSFTEKNVSSPQAVFTNSTPIIISDGAADVASPYPSSINVSGLTGTIANTPGSIKVTLNNFSHTYPDDVYIALVSPTGAAFLLQDGAGAGPDVNNITYTLSDTGADFLPDNTAWTNGTYKPTAWYLPGATDFPAPGPGLNHSDPGPDGGSSTFSSVFGGTAPNGNWNLYVADFNDDDGGSFAGGWTLEITTGTTAPPAKPQHVVDFDGDGKTDFALVRNVGGGANGQIEWFIKFNGTNGYKGADWGLASDFFTPADFDGDGKTDIAVWRPVSAGQPDGNAYFYILQSQTNTVRIEDFGQSGDDPSVVGDYDGDGKADVAVYREGANSGQQSTWFFRGSLNNPNKNITYVPWGNNGDFPSPGDYDGDGKYDFVIQRANNGSGVFWFMQSTAGYKTQTFGYGTDTIAPGDFDGDGKTDLGLIRDIDGNLHWYYAPSSGGGYIETVFGYDTDYAIQGDYDGDGKTDVAVYRPSPNKDETVFWYFGSTSGSNVISYGTEFDYPVANFNVR